MSAKLPVDNAEINAVAIPASEFIHGTANYVMNGQDIANTTADGRIHNLRQVVSSECSFELFGDRTELNSTVGLGVNCVLKYGTDVMATVKAIVSAVYNESNNSTNITLKCDS